MDWIIELIIGFVASNPEMSGILLVMGFLRAINKPIFALIDASVKATPSLEDDSKWAKIKASKGMERALWFLDMFASAKIKVKK